MAEAHNRRLALIYLQYDVYNSPAPASFIRHDSSSKNLTYEPHEYLSVILTSRIGRGATGVLHSGRLELETSDGRKLVYEVAVKLAFLEEQCTRLEHEYSIYRHLAAANVKGIMGALGLFRDLEGQTMALVLTYGGISLWERDSRRGLPISDTVTPVSESERYIFFYQISYCVEQYY